MSGLEPTTIVGNAISTANPFASVKPALDGVTKLMIPYVDQVSQQTTGLIVRDPGLAFYVTLLFVVSLLVIVVSDRVNMTRNLRTAMIEAHLVFLKMLRGIVTVGLFMVGRRIGSSGGFLGGLQEASGFIETTTTTWFLQKLVEWFTEVNPNNGLYAADTFNAVIDEGSFLQSIMLVIHDYLQTYNDTVIASVTGDLVVLNGLTAQMGFAIVTGDKSAGAATVGRVKTLYQLYSLSLAGQGTTNMAKTTGGFSGDALWYYSPLFVGVVVGML